MNSFAFLVDLFISSNPNEPLSPSDTQSLEDLVIELESKSRIEELPMVSSDVGYIQNEGDSRIFLSASKQRYVLKQTDRKVEVKDIITNSPLIEGGVKLLFRRW